MLTTLFKSVVVLAVIFAGALSSADAAKILFVGNSGGPTSGADGAVMTHLTDRFGSAAVLGDEGVFYMQGSASATADAALVDAIIISATLGSGSVRGKFQDVPQGVLNWEQALTRQRAGEFNLSENGATSGNQTQIDIVDPSHPLAAGLSGTVTVTTSPQTMSHGNDGLGAGVVLVANLTVDANEHGIMAAEAGADLLGGNTAAGRRVMFFLENNNFDELTPDGILLFDAATDWTINVIPEPSTFVLAALGLLGLLGFGRRRRK